MRADGGTRPKKETTLFISEHHWGTWVVIVYKLLKGIVSRPEVTVWRMGTKFSDILWRKGHVVAGCEGYIKDKHGPIKSTIPELCLCVA